MELRIELIERALTKPGKTKGGLADALGIAQSGVTAILAGTRRIQASEVAKIIDYLDLQRVAVMGRIGAGATIEPEHEQIPPDGLFVVEIPFFMPEEMVAFEVEGDSMVPRYDPGDVIVVWKDQKRPLENFFGQEVAIRTKDGKRFLKTLLPGKGKLVTLRSFNASKDIENVKIAWIGEIYVVVRKQQVRRIQP